MFDSERKLIDWLAIGAAAALAGTVFFGLRFVLLIVVAILLPVASWHAGRVFLLMGRRARQKPNRPAQINLADLIGIVLVLNINLSLSRIVKGTHGFDSILFVLSFAFAIITLYVRLLLVQEEVCSVPKARLIAFGSNLLYILLALGLYLQQH